MSFFTKTVQSKAMRQVSNSSLGSFREKSSLPKRSTRNSGILPGKSSLALALNKSRNMKKRKTSFLGGSVSNAQGKNKKQGISFGHVLFETGEKAVSAPTRTVSLSSNESSNIMGSDIMKRKSILSKKSSLWSKVSDNGFQKR